MYNGRTFHREQVYLCGEYLDGDIYPVFQPAGKRRGRCKPTSAIQERLNQKNAEKRLTRIVHANFAPDDLALHLTYRLTPESGKEAMRLVRNFLRKLQRRYRKLGIAFKYILSTEYGGRGGRIHHHLIVTGGLDRDEIERLWEHGFANSKRLQFTENGVTGLAHYITKDRHFYKRWSGSRNLAKPAPAQVDGQITMEEVMDLADAAESGTAHEWFEARYPDFELVCCVPYRNNINRGVYIHFEMRRKKQEELRKAKELARSGARL